MRTHMVQVAFLIGGLLSLPASAALIDLEEYAFNINGVTTNGAAPAGVNLGGFDTTTGLGNVQVKLSGTGSQFVGLFVDHDLDEPGNTYFNESGLANGAVMAGQSWEIDEPGYVFGDIYDNLLDSTAASSGLDGGNDVPAGREDDVSMAMGWNFMLAAGEQATINFTVSELVPVGVFYLTQTDPDSQASIYFSSSLRIAPIPMPEPGTLLLGLAGLGLIARRRG